MKIHTCENCDCDPLPINKDGCDVAICRICANCECDEGKNLNMKVIREIDLTFDHFAYWIDHKHISVRTSEHDAKGRCDWQSLKLDDEGKNLIDKLSEWILRNLK